MQQLGTEVCRTIHSDTWILALHRAMTIRIYEDRKDFVIDDVRFNNEADAIRQWGGEIWTVKRPLLTLSDQHTSETGITSTHVNDKAVINNGSIQELHDKVSIIMNYIKERQT